MNKKNISVKFEKRSLILGVLLIMLGIIVPIFLNVHNFGIYEILFKSLGQGDKSLLLIGAVRLVLLNSIRGLPHYLGAFIIAESTDLSIKGKNVPHIKGFIALIIIPLVYSAINTIYKIKYDLGVPAFIVIFAIMYLEKMDFTEISLVKKTFIIVLLLLGVQWLDVIPELSLLGFGRGETSQDLKAIAEIIYGSEILTLFASMLFVIFTFNAFLVTKLINDEHKILVTTERNRRIEHELNEARIEALQARNYIELKNLVHDLKTPLTSSQALVSVLRMMDVNEDPKKQLYLKKVEQSIDKLNDMISEILYEDKKDDISTEELFNYIFSHISHLPLASCVVYENYSKNSHVKVNKIRFTRAIINALDNSYNALSDDNGEIKITIESDNDSVYIDIVDNGIGIEEEMFEEISTRGFSIRQSTGLGLSFIKDVVDSHEGKMHIKSEYGLGTDIKIILSRVNISEQENISD